MVPQVGCHQDSLQSFYKTDEHSTPSISINGRKPLPLSSRASQDLQVHNDAMTAITAHPSILMPIVILLPFPIPLMACVALIHTRTDLPPRVLPSPSKVVKSQLRRAIRRLVAILVCRDTECQRV